MSDAERLRNAGQVLVAGFPGKEAPGRLLEQAREGHVGGAILFRRNLGDVHDVATLIAELAGAFPTDLPPMIAVDQEGGRVRRLGEPVLTLPPMRELAACGEPALIERAGHILGQQLAAIGFTMDFAPVLDVNTNPDNPVIGDRAFGDTPDEVIRYALPFADGLQRAGLAACGKHFPGHGDTDLDSHLALPRLPHNRKRLDAVELAPFRAAQGRVDAIMTAHVVFDCLAPGVPATLAPEVVTTLLRGELGYTGLIISDDLEMKAVANMMSIEESACLAIAAGCDTLLICSDLDWVDRARAALARRAAEDATFEQRLADAAERSLSLRRRRPSRPAENPAMLDAVLNSPECQRLREDLARARPA